MATSTVENYLKALYAIEQRSGRDLVPLGELGRQLGVTPGTVTTMIKSLARRGLVDYQVRRGAKLTDKGEKEALHVLRRHRLIELFLVEVMKFDWTDVHDEAEVLEHAVSDRLIDKLDAMLGFPTHDPHGDPIPAASGEIDRKPQICLAECEPGRRTVTRVSDHSPAFLQFITDQGLEPGTAIEVVARDPIADTITVRRPDGKTVQLGSAAGHKVFVLEE